ncbi:DUF502 domain-containing protein [Halovenus rubra]|uniref:DUF502 domain-containing protein n=2 Tax=Halovenus rubra TaxID=869890 RepID=A0ABD5X8G0_9EURY|nr:DUF502 domain-containing protein [Halovenus rubra]
MSYLQKARDSFIAGLVLVIPLVVTLYILQLLSDFAFLIIDPVVQETELESFTRNVEAVARVLAAVLIVVVLTLIGFLAQRQVGQRLFGSLGRSVKVIPVFRTIYTTVRQISQSFSNTETSYDSLVLVEFPRKGLYTIGLVTSKSPEAVNETVGKTVYNVFLPSSPNPASGRLVLVPEDEVHEIDISVRQGMGLLMTTGAGSDQSTTPPTDVTVSPEEAIAALEELEDAGTDEIAVTQQQADEGSESVE